MDELNTPDEHRLGAVEDHLDLGIAKRTNRRFFTMPTGHDNPASIPLKGALSALGFGPEDDQITEQDLPAFVPTKPNWAPPPAGPNEPRPASPKTESSSGANPEPASGQTSVKKTGEADVSASEKNASEKDQRVAEDVTGALAEAQARALPSGGLDNGDPTNLAD
jgi:hypothetical protein